MTSADESSAEAGLPATAVAEVDQDVPLDGVDSESLDPEPVDPGRADEDGATEDGSAASGDPAPVADQAEDGGDTSQDSPAPARRGGDDSDNPLEMEAEVAADYLEELLDIADLDGDIDTYVDSDRAHVSIVSDSSTLVGRDGEVLDALQELTRLAVMAETGERSRLMLDVAGYRARRRTELVALAGDAVQEVKDSSEPVHLAAMNPFERKIVHDAVAAAGLTSESEGEEPRRHVVVLPARG